MFEFGGTVVLREPLLPPLLEVLTVFQGSPWSRRLQPSLRQVTWGLAGKAFQVAELFLGVPTVVGSVGDELKVEKSSRASLRAAAATTELWLNPDVTGRSMPSFAFASCTI